MSVSVYIIECIDNGKKYVGITGGSIDSRWRAHQSSARCGSKLAVHSAIRKYGAGRFTVTCVDSLGDWPEACAEERRLIEELGAHISMGGYNMTAGGEGLVGLSEESRARIALAHRRENLMSSTVQKMRNAKVGRILSDETKSRMSFAHLGKKFSDVHRKKIGDANRGDNCSSETRQKISRVHSRPVEQLTELGETVAVYVSIVEASRVTGIHSTNISACCLGNRPRARGFVWRYVDDVAQSTVVTSATHCT